MSIHLSLSLHCLFTKIHTYIHTVYYKEACFHVPWQGMITVEPVVQETSLNIQARLLKVSLVMPCASEMQIVLSRPSVRCMSVTFLSLVLVRRWQEVPSDCTRYLHLIRSYGLCWKHRDPDSQWAAGLQQVWPHNRTHALYCLLQMWKLKCCMGPKRIKGVRLNLGFMFIYFVYL